jgi:phage recombination protein Bet
MENKSNKGLQIDVKVGKNAIQSLASRLQIDPDALKSTLKATAFRECQNDAEFISAVIVANAYGLNPLLKEIYAYPDKKGVIPVVSTDGWTRLMVNHPLYKTHKFVYAENIIDIKGAKPCPEWCEIVIEKKDGSTVVIREYLDEVYRAPNYASPWQTHTKRMLRHKTKIQGAREAFGFSGIYDEDEAHRIVEAEVTRTDVKQIASPQSISGKTEKTGEVFMSVSELDVITDSKDVSVGGFVSKIVEAKTTGKTPKDYTEFTVADVPEASITETTPVIIVCAMGLYPSISKGAFIIGHKGEWHQEKGKVVVDTVEVRAPEVEM